MAGDRVARSDAERELDRLLAACRCTVHPGQQRRPRLLLDWLGEQPGTHGRRWVASDASAQRARWRAIPARWLAGQGRSSRKWVTAVSVALRAAVCADIVRPSLGWLLSGGMADNHFAQVLAAERYPAGFARLQGSLDADPDCRRPAG